eukprot:2324628-Prymnesium_polylepis.2
MQPPGEILLGVTSQTALTSLQHAVFVQHVEARAPHRTSRRVPRPAGVASASANASLSLTRPE